MRDDTASRLGMWLFLFTEFMLFGVMFLIYAVYRANYSRDFHQASLTLDISLGSFNTFVLLTSSLTMVLCITAMLKRDRELSISFLLATIVLGVLFLVNKFFEWREKFHHGLFPGSEHFADLAPGQGLFYTLYFIMTGIHGLHIVAGVVLLAMMLVLICRGRITAERYVLLDNAGLYWHLVDIIWIFLLPLFYLAT